MKTIFAIYISVLLGLVACRNPQEPSYIILDLESAINGNEPDNMVLNCIAEVTRIIPTETNDSTLLMKISIAGVTEKHVIIYDRGRVYFINKEDGKISSRLSKQGKGPGEYNDIGSIAVSEGDSLLYLFDPRMSQLNIYTFGGGFVGNVQNDSMGGFALLNDGNFALLSSPYLKMDYHIGIYDKSWNLKRTGISKLEDRKYDIYQFNHINRFNGEYYYRPISCDTIYHITSICEKPYIVISKGEYKMPLTIETDIERKGKTASKYIQGEYGLLISNYLFLTFYYNDKLYSDIWNTETSSLIYRSKCGGIKDIYHVPISINGIKINIWPTFSEKDNLYCIVQAEDAVKLIPSLPMDTNPIILELKLKSVKDRKTF